MKQDGTMLHDFAQDIAVRPCCEWRNTREPSQVAKSVIRLDGMMEYILVPVEVDGTLTNVL